MEYLATVHNSFFVIVGPGAAGKDFLRRKLQKKGFKYSISYTNRDMREGEIDGEDYIFVSRDFFEDKFANNPEFWLETTNFGGYYYGTPREHTKICNIFVMDLNGLRSLDEELRSRAFVIFLNPDPSVLLERMIARGWNEEKILARRKLDDSIFSNFTDYDMLVTNSNF